jgi:hypothetical protein
MSDIDLTILTFSENYAQQLSMGHVNHLILKRPNIHVVGQQDLFTCQPLVTGERADTTHLRQRGAGGARYPYGVR